MNKRKVYLVIILLQVIAIAVSVGTYLTKKDNMYSQSLLINEFELNGYGYPVGVFYGDILLYFPAIFV